MSLASLRNDMLIQMNAAYWDGYVASVDFDWAGNYLRQGNLEWAGKNLEWAAAYFFDFVQGICGNVAWDWTTSPEYQWMELAEGAMGAEFTMDLLLSTMLGAESEQVKYFTGLTDAYRQSVWNKPFNKDFYAALARGFEQWE